MYSNDMIGLGEESSSIREIAKKAALCKKEIGTEYVHDFSLGNPNAQVPESVTDCLHELLNERKMIHGYTENRGDHLVRDAIAKDITNRFGLEATSEDVFMTCGAAASLTITLKAITNREDEVLVIAPFFPEYKVFIENAKAKMVVCESNMNFDLDFEEIPKNITEKTKAIIINSPNNPTGKVYDFKSLQKLSSLLREKSEEYGHPIFIISDEPYREIIFDDKNHSFLPGIYDNTIVCYSYSKSMCLAGERIGYILTNKKNTEQAKLQAAIAGAARSQGYVCAPSIFQYAIAKNINCFSDITHYEKNREIMVNGLRECGYQIDPPEGAFYIFMKSLEKDSKKFCEKAIEENLFIVPGVDFYRDGYVRISICVSEETCKNSIPAFKKLYEKYEK